MELHGGPATRSGCLAARKKRSNLCRQPHPNPTPIADGLNILALECLATDNGVNEPFLKSGLLGNWNNMKQLKRKLGAITQAYQTNSMSESVRSSDVLRLAPRKQMSFSCSRGRSRGNVPTQEPTPRCDDNDDVSEQPSPSKGLEIDTASCTPIEATNPSSPNEGTTSSSSTEADTSSSPIEFATPSSPIEFGTPSSPIEAGTLSSPIEADTPSTPIEAATLSTPIAATALSTSPIEAPTPTPTQATLPTNEVSDSTTLGDNELCPSGLWFHCNHVVRDITRCIQRHYDGPYTCWSTTPSHVKEHWWKDFKDQYKWNPDLEQKVRIEFEKKGAIRLKDMVYRACKANEVKPARWMSEEVREELKKVRDTPEFKKKSLQFSKNKVTGPNAGAKHCQGSVSTRELAARLAAKNGGEVLPPWEIFKVTHQRKDKSFIDDKSKKVWDTYEGLKTDPETKDGSQKDVDLFLRASGGWTKKGTLYGLGSGADIYFRKPTNRTSQSTVTPLCTPDVVFQLQSRLEKQTEELNQTKEELQQQKQLVDDQRRLYQEQREALQRLEAQLRILSQLLDRSGDRGLSSRDQTPDPSVNASPCS